MTDITSTDIMGLDRPLWGVAQIAPEVGKTEVAAAHLLRQGRIPARKIGRQWVSSLRLLRQITAPESTASV